MKTLLLLVFLKTTSGRVQLAENLYLYEVRCHCHDPLCSHVYIHERTIRSFQLTRNDFGSRVNVTNAHRCIMHNKSVGGAEKSKHLTGDAIDIYPDDSHDLDTLAEYAKEHFDKVILYRDKGFVHCHNNTIFESYTLLPELLQSLDMVQ